MEEQRFRKPSMVVRFYRMAQKNMSRLLKHKQKKALINLVLIVIGIFIIFTIGFQFIIKGSVFIANFFSDKSETDQVNNQILGEININEIPSATNSSKIKVSGSTYNMDSVLIFLNKQEVDKIDINSKNDFSAIIDNLNVGENELYFIGLQKKSEQRKKTDIFTIISKTTKPKIEISSPKDRSITPKTEINIIGKTDIDVVIKINDQPVVVSSDGSFNHLVRLTDGENKFIINAEDEAGNTDSLTLTIVYEK